MPTKADDRGNAALIKEFAAAKINLCLHVTGKRIDGYHLLDSVVVFADVGDRLTLSPATGFSLQIKGQFGAELDPGADNLIARAAAKLGPGVPGAAVTLDKILPVAAGIGGGSADAAAALRGLKALYDLQSISEGKMDAIALSLGADVPVCLRSRALRMSGIGERLEEFPTLPALPAVLVNPGVAVPTGPVFKTLNLGGGNNREKGLIGVPEKGLHTSAQAASWLQHQRNDLEPAALRLVPAVGTVLNTLNAQRDCLLARMSGSGATCFGLFGTKQQAEAFASKLAGEHPEWWVVSTVLT